MTAFVRFKDGDLLAVLGDAQDARRVLLGEFEVRAGFVCLRADDGDVVWVDRASVDRVLTEVEA